MAGFPRKERQRIIDGYLNESGSNHFVPAEFLDWLKDRPDHEAYDLFYGRSDEEDARRHRIAMVRTWVSGLRISVQAEEPVQSTVKKITVVEHKVPAMISPRNTRKDGGGYVSVDLQDEEITSELLGQAAADLRRWIERYQGIAALKGINIAQIEKIARSLENTGVVPAA